MSKVARIAATTAAFVIAMVIVGLIREGLHGPGGAIIGAVQIALFVGLPFLVWKATAPKPD